MHIRKSLEVARYAGLSAAGDRRRVKPTASLRGTGQRFFSHDAEIRGLANRCAQHKFNLSHTKCAPASCYPQGLMSTSPFRRRPAAAFVLNLLVIVFGMGKCRPACPQGGLPGSEAEHRERNLRSRLRRMPRPGRKGSTADNRWISAAATHFLISRGATKPRPKTTTRGRLSSAMVDLSRLLSDYAVLP